MKKKLKKLPKLISDKGASNFISRADLSAHDLSELKKVSFEFDAKSRAVSIRLPERLYAVVKEKAARDGIKTQRFIRRALEQAVS